MKTIHHPIAAAVLAAAAFFGNITPGHATDVRLDGSGYYELGRGVNYYPNGVRQGGRYGNLGRDYYRKTTISMQWITNHSSNRSGDMSYEFWGMRYYGATTGIVLMTHGLGPLSGGRYYRNVRRRGNAVLLDEYRFPEINLWEYTRSGWRWRDALSFTRKTLL